MKNINKMRQVFIVARDAGNKTITKKMVTDNGITEGYFQSWCNIADKLHALVCSYIDEARSPNSDGEKIARLRNLIFAQWKEALSCAQPDEDSNALKANAEDLTALIGYAEKFQAESNGKSAKKLISHAKINPFRRNVETFIGIRIAEVSVMTDAVRDFLNTEKKLLKSIRRAKGAIETKTITVATLESVKAKVGVDEALVFEAQIKQLENEINESKVAKAKFETALVDHQAKKDEAYSTPQVYEVLVEEAEKSAA